MLPYVLSVGHYALGVVLQQVYGGYCCRNQTPAFFVILVQERFITLA